MKSLKRIFSVFLSFVMVLSIAGTSCITSYAAGAKPAAVKGISKSKSRVTSVSTSNPGIINTSSAAAPKLDSSAGASVWNGTADTSWYTGGKTTYIISTAEQLAGFALLVNNREDEYRFDGVTINLVNDIILNDTSNFDNWKSAPPANKWEPIGRIGSPLLGYCPFAGTFNGNGHTISGMYIDLEGPSGLFSYLSQAVVTNVRITNSFIVNNTESRYPCGALSGCVESALIDNCSADNIRIYNDGYWGEGHGAGSTGGLVGAATRINVLPEFMLVSLMGFGIAVNPIVFAAGNTGEKSTGTYFQNCIVTNTVMECNSVWAAAPIGGIAGRIEYPTAFFNCATSGIFVSSNDEISYGGTYETGECGAIFGNQDPEVELVVRDCWGANFFRTDAGTTRSDAQYVPIR